MLEWVAMPSSRDLPDSGIKPVASELQVNSLPLSHWGSPIRTHARTHTHIYIYIISLCKYGIQEAIFCSNWITKFH